MTAPPAGEIEVRYVSEDAVQVVTDWASVDLGSAVRGLPVRRVRSYARQRHYSGLFWSATTGGHVVYESRLELDRLWLADFDADVVGIAAQPFWICRVEGSRILRHVPDFLLRRRGGWTVVDVKPAEFAARPDVRDVLDWTQSVCRARGVDYEVWNGGDAALLGNVKLLGSARRAGLGRALLERLAGSVHDGMTFREASMSVAGCAEGVARAGLFALLWTGVLVTDLSRPLSARSVLTRSR